MEGFQVVPLILYYSQSIKFQFILTFFIFYTDIHQRKEENTCFHWCGLGLPRHT